MKNHYRLFSTALLAAAIFAPVARANTLYTAVTGFTTDNNIYTDLNQWFPNTGAGTPGSGVGVANATFVYNPATFTNSFVVSGSNLTSNSATFTLASNSAGQDFEQLNSGQQLTISSNIANATAVYLLTSAYFGTSFNVTFNGTGGASETFTNITAPNFYSGLTINSTSSQNGGTNNLLDQTVLQVNTPSGANASGNSATGSSGVYDLTEQTFILSSAFLGQDLTSAVITSNGSTTLVFGETVASNSTTTSSAPEPATLFLAAGALMAMIGRARRRGEAGVPQKGLSR